MASVAYAALWAFIFAIPWENTVVIPGLGTISRLLGMVAMLFALIAGAVSGRMRHWHAFHIAAALFMIWSGFGLLVLQTKGIPSTFYTYLQLLLVVWMMWEIAPSRQRQLGLAAAYVFGAYVAAISTIVVYRREAAVMRRFAAGGFDPNDLAMTLALALPIAWYLGLTYQRPLLRWICRGFLPIGLIALGLTGSRGGLLASMVGLLIVPLTMTKLSSGKLAAAMLLLVVSGVVAVAYIPETTMERLATTRSELSEGGFNGRLNIWKAGVEAFAARPVVGYGTGGFEAAIEPILGSARSSHNSYLTVMVEQGIVGFAFYAGMFFSVFVAVLNLPQSERRFGLVLLATLGVAMLPLAWEDSKPAWFVLASLLGLAKAEAPRMAAAVWHPRQRRPAFIADPASGGGRRGPMTAPVQRAERDATS